MQQALATSRGRTCVCACTAADGDTHTAHLGVIGCVSMQHIAQLRLAVLRVEAARVRERPCEVLFNVCRSLPWDALRRPGVTGRGALGCARTAHGSTRQAEHAERQHQRWIALNLLKPQTRMCRPDGVGAVSWQRPPAQSARTAPCLRRWHTSPPARYQTRVKGFATTTAIALQQPGGRGGRVVPWGPR